MLISLVALVSVRAHYFMVHWWIGTYSTMLALCYFWCGVSVRAGMDAHRNPWIKQNRRGVYCWVSQLLLGSSVNSFNWFFVFFSLLLYILSFLCAYSAISGRHFRCKKALHKIKSTAISIMHQLLQFKCPRAWRLPSRPNGIFHNCMLAIWCTLSYAYLLCCRFISNGKWINCFILMVSLLLVMCSVSRCKRHGCSCV